MSCLEAWSSVGHSYSFADRSPLAEGIILMEKSCLFITCMWPSIRHKAQIMTETKSWQSASSAKTLPACQSAVPVTQQGSCRTVKWKTGLLYSLLSSHLHTYIVTHWTCHLFNYIIQYYYIQKPGVDSLSFTVFPKIDAALRTGWG